MPQRRRPFSILIATFIAFAFCGEGSSIFAEPGVPTADTNAPAVPTPVVPPTPSPNVDSAAGSPVKPATAPVLTTPSTTTSSVVTGPGTVSYTVVSGDSLWSIAHKNGCTVTALKKANHLTKTHLKPGQVLKIPTSTTKSSQPAPAADAKPSASIPRASHKIYPHAQPVQDFDLPASTFASCPEPPDPETIPPVMQAPSTAPVAKLVSPDEFAAEAPAPEKITVDASIPVPPVSVAIVPAPRPLVVHDTADASIKTSNVPPAAMALVAPPPKPVSRFAGLFSFFGSTPTGDWGSRFTEQARALGDRGLEYNEDWRPPGEAHDWSMDCSNTSRYLYKVTANIDLPRTASDQYYFLHLQNKAWDAPQAANGFADCNYLRHNLKEGDLLFWENTYRPERQPPITHVMVFLGSNDKGQWIMAGSQTSRGGEHNRRNGGPDIYVFDPTKPCGGYTTWLGFVHHQGRFCAFGRPLEADPSKLAVAAND